MNVNVLNDAINMVDDDLISEAYSADYLKKKTEYKKILAFAAVFAFVTVAVSAICGKYIYNSLGVEKVTEISTSLLFGGADITEKVTDENITYEGALLTESEIKEYLESKKYDIVGAVAAEYDMFDSVFRISTKGYGHVSLGGENRFPLDVIDFPVSVDGKIIAVVTIFRSGDESLRYDISTRGKFSKNLNNALEENDNSELAFFYVDLFTEVAVNRENKIYIIKGKESVSLDGGIDYYKLFKTEYNVFSLNDLKDENNYISVVPLPEEKVTRLVMSEAYSEPLTQSQNAMVMTFKNDMLDVDLTDILENEISSVEWCSSYDILAGGSYRECTEKQEKVVFSYLSEFDSKKTENYDMVFGGTWNVKFNFTDGTWAILILLGERYYIETAEGTSRMFAENSGNIISLSYYLAEL